jgi:hypothetical protein
VVASQTHLISMVVGGLFVLLIIALRVRRMGRAQRLKLEWLWVVPTLMSAAAAATLVHMPPASGDWPWLVLALAVGAGFGWLRGATMAITVDPQTHELNMKATPQALFLLAGLFIVRFAMRGAIMDGAAASWHLSAVFITDLFIVFAVGLFAVQRLEMALRARRLLAEARAAGA